MVVEFDRVTKYFLIGHRTNGIKDAIVSVLGKGRKYGEHTRHGVVRDLTFAVAEGETFGIIGPNGAGKSTILKMAAGILYPNKGTVSVKGRVSSLLEVGAGFQPDLTGRENIFLYGTILGLTKSELKRELESIVDFSGIDGKFIDVPVKYYSSGMYMRLAFSVAVHSQPEVLIADEVLSVGDSNFQEKCLRKISELRAGGVTVLYVSHDLSSIQRLCENVLLLKGDGTASVGTAKEQIQAYLHLNSI
ncbi:hypothetical protein Alches_20820 [Alicyclobacillus hesperidum subsp. aegles]|uniref:ABC transporter ATP-binding protein n=1 Tax=Alicyclobacillus hesperidum TaxID=89784 RepID=UPI000719257D|nr:ABC transporter ATP-binding protein [Alicyclobacillus hesperidum]GLG02041.1 hypothetical protein Alches_20820 [Alicyclobacillus hesperidum subsp. aegles]